MPLKRVTPEEIAAKGVVAAPDRLTGKAADNKAIFDRLVKEIVAETFNALLDALEAQTGAAGLGAAPFEHVAGETIQRQLMDIEANHEKLQEVSGAGYVGAAPFGAVSGATVQRQMEETHGILRGAGGAAYVGAEPFNGVPSGDVQGQIRDVQGNINALVEGTLPVDSVTEEMIAPGAVSSAKLAEGAVTGGKLAGEAVSREKLSPVVRALIDALRPGAPAWERRRPQIVTGRIFGADAGWHSVSFPKPLDGPPVVSLILEAPDGTPSGTPATTTLPGVAVVRSVTTWGFQWAYFTSTTTAGTWEFTKSAVTLHYFAVYEEELR